jgi:hypothetical protein
VGHDILRDVGDTLKRPRTRPTFALELPVPPEVVTERVRARLASHGAALEGSVHRRTIFLTVRAEARTFWSPHLDVQLDGTEAGGTRLFARFAPSPNVWASFLASQAVCALLGIGALVYATSLWTLGREVWPALAAFAGLFVLGGLSYGAAYVGQGLGSEQMYELRAFLDGALEEP